MSIIDGRRFEHEGERDDVLDACQLLTNKQGGPLLAHGRSGAYTDDKRVLVPMIVSVGCMRQAAKAVPRLCQACCRHAQAAGWA